MRHSTILAVIVGVLTCTAVQAGDVYKYTDERGNTMYTDRPMPGGYAQKQKSGPGGRGRSLMKRFQVGGTRSPLVTDE